MRAAAVSAHPPRRASIFIKYGRNGPAGALSNIILLCRCVSCKYNEKAVPVGTAFSRLLRNGMPYLCVGSRQLTCACAVPFCFAHAQVEQQHHNGRGQRVAEVMPPDDEPAQGHKGHIGPAKRPYQRAAAVPLEADVTGQCQDEHTARGSRVAGRKAGTAVAERLHPACKLCERALEAAARGGEHVVKARALPDSLDNVDGGNPGQQIHRKIRYCKTT